MRSNALRVVKRKDKGFVENSRSAEHQILHECLKGKNCPKLFYNAYP